MVLTVIQWSLLRLCLSLLWLGLLSLSLLWLGLLRSFR